jgi:uncharacterized protein (DUF433 family)
MNVEESTMSQTDTDYAYQTADGGWRISDSRVSLDSVVHAYLEGKSPEAIAEEFPALAVGQVFGAIAFYLRNKQAIDEYLVQQDAKWQQLAAQNNAKFGPLLDRLRRGQQPGADD